MPRHHGAVPDATNSKAWILILSLGVSLFVMESAKDDILTAMDVVIWTQDGSLIRNRKTIYFSFDRFLKDIVHGNRCFICGANPELVPFNDEHVLPDWILRRYGLHNRVIILPNYTRFRYGQFKIPKGSQRIRGTLIVLRPLLAELRSSAEDARLDRSRGDAEHARQLVLTPTLHAIENEQIAHSRGQTGAKFIDQVPGDAFALLVGYV